MPILYRAYEISSQARSGVYDCVYLALAEREGCEFITADESLSRNSINNFRLFGRCLPFDYAPT